MSEQLVIFVTAGSADEARVIQAVLRASDIPAVVEGDSLMDEWAVSQRLMGQIGSSVKVPESAVERARAALDQALEQGLEIKSSQVIKGLTDPPSSETEQEGEIHPEDKLLDEYVLARRWPRSAVTTVGCLLGALIVLTILWVRNEQENRWLTESPLYEWSWDSVKADMVAVSKETGLKVRTFHDADRDRIEERLDEFLPGGALISQSFDRDENGVWERWVQFSPNSGKVVLEVLDRDQDRVPDRVSVMPSGGVRFVFEDKSGNRELELVEPAPK